jgi:cobalt-zinc-cadmium efflux system membrane fusion protein
MSSNDRWHSQSRWALAFGASWMILLSLCVGCARTSNESAGHDEHEGSGDHAETVERGPQGGRLFKDGALQVELRIEETGIPPEFRAHLYDAKSRPLTVTDTRMSVVLERFGGRRDSLAFRAEGDRLRSVRSVVEPHSFKAHVIVEREGRRHEWKYEQHEGRVELATEAVAQAAIQTAQAGQRLIEVRIATPGEVRLNAERVVQVRPRFPGIAQKLLKRLGDPVQSGDLLAVVHSNESLSDYEIRSSMAGVVVAREVAVGQAVNHESVLYTIADLSTVWVDVALYPQIAGQVRRGQAVRVRSEGGGSVEAEGTISYVGPLLEQDTRVSYGRVVLPNRDSRWQPGMFITAAIIVDRFRAAVAVPEEAIVRTSRGPCVFRAEGNVFELQPVTPGRSDGEWTEIVEGLESGARIVIRNAFLLKAELGKSEATHDH